MIGLFNLKKAVDVEAQKYNSHRDAEAQRFWTYIVLTTVDCFFTHKVKCGS